MRWSGDLLWICRATLIGFLRHEGAIMAGHMAFLGLLSLFPFLIFLTSLAGLFGGTMIGAQAIAQFLDTLPPDVAVVIKGPIDEVVAGSPSALTFGALIAIWTASNGIEAARTAIRRAYLRRPVQPAWSRRLESLALVVVVAGLILVGMGLQILGPTAWGIVSAKLDPPATVARLWGWLRFGLSPLVLYLALFGTYAVLGPRSIIPRFQAPGALLALVLWLITAGGLSLYLRNFGQYDVTYGSLAGVIIALLFFYLSGIAFILGAELNAAFTRRAQMRHRTRHAD